MLLLFTWTLATTFFQVHVSSQPPNPPIASGATVYRDTIDSVVWIISERRNGVATGSGTLIDRDRRLILTNYHVVGDNPNATVMFPVFRNEQPIPERNYYRERSKRLGIRGKVLELDKAADLAIIQISQLPADADGVALAAASPTPGETVHSIGNAGSSGALFGYVRGTVRQVYQKRWQAQLDRRVVTFQAKVIETDSPTNPGDSGGPLLNDQSQLVGVTQGGAVKANSVSTFIDVSEVKQLLARPALRNLRTSKVTKTDPGKPSPTITIEDRAELFSKETIDKVKRLVTETKDFSSSIFVESIPQLADDIVAQWPKMDAASKQDFFQNLAQEKRSEESLSGTIILITQQPRYLHVDIPASLLSVLPEGTAKEVSDRLRKGLSANQADTGLMDSITYLLKTAQNRKEK